MQLQATALETFNYLLIKHAFIRINVIYQVSEITYLIYHNKNIYSQG